MSKELEICITFNVFIFLLLFCLWSIANIPSVSYLYLREIKNNTKKIQSVFDTIENISN